jgi:hypothetical protein
MVAGYTARGDSLATEKPAAPVDDSASVHVTVLPNFFDELRRHAHQQKSGAAGMPFGPGGADPPNSSIAVVL